MLERFTENVEKKQRNKRNLLLNRKAISFLRGIAFFMVQLFLIIRVKFIFSNKGKISYRPKGDFFSLQMFLFGIYNLEKFIVATND